MPEQTIVTCFPMSPEERSQLENGLVERFGVLVSDQQEIASDIFEADIFCGHAKHQQIDWEKVVQKGRLKWIQSSAAGLDHCLHPATIESPEIVISGCSGLFARQVAEQTLALLFGLIRSQMVFAAAQQVKEFIRRPTDNLFTKTIGILGMGGNGQYLANRLRPFCSRILGTDCFPEQVADHDGIEVFHADETTAVVAQSDVVIAMLPLTEQTFQCIGAECFEAMPRGSYFLNVGRGLTVNEGDLISALQAGRLRGVGLDVVAEEPLSPASPLWEMENVMITPHVGAQACNRVSSTISLFCQNVERYLGGDCLINQVDKQLGFPHPVDRLTTPESF